ncbi:MAG: 30S ribosomal protein S3ae [Candidatus Methanomethylophilaceae archaeon]|nr:30S ribosomal protein S3ae [Candidatus Methanomethylophilaceae archaeon]
MAPSKRAKASAGRKVKDKWKAKEWYKIHAPRMFNEAEIGETPSAEPDYVLGRTAEVTVQDLTGDFSKMHIKLKFKVTSLDGYDAKTAFIGHDLTSDYVRRLTRRRKTKTDHVVDIVTKDGYTYRIKTMSIAERRIQSSQEDGMRRIIAETLVAIGQERTLSEIVKDIVSGDLAKELARACRIVIPVKRIEIRKSEVLVAGESEPESILPAAEPVAEEPAAEPVEEPVEETPAEAPAEE